MKAINWKKILPHIIAFVIFLVVAVIYCKPALEDQVLQQSDITQFKGAYHQSELFYEQHGRAPLWTTSMFGGMPTFQIGAPTNNVIPYYFHNILTLGLPAPIQFFFLACICFYFLCVILRVNPYIGIMGSLAFAYATYNPIIIAVGHATKMWSIAYMPALLGSMILIFQKRYWIGAALTALFTSTLISRNHPQVDYYLFLVIAIMTIFYLVDWIRNKQWAHTVKALSFAVGAALIGVLTNAVTLFSTYEYQKETIRGGGSVLTDTTNKDKSQTGLDRDYAFSYSMEIAEPFVLMVPRMFGGSGDKEEVSQEKSRAIEALSALPPQLQQQLPILYYWGGIRDVGGFTFTSGPPYSGAIICFLAIMSVFVIDRKYKWWMLTATGLAVIMSWGSYFPAFNNFLFEYLPFYNKFRAPSMIMVIPQLLLPIMAVLAADKYIRTEDRKWLQAKFKKGLIATGVIILLLFFMYLSFDFLTKGDKDLLQQAQGANQPQLYDAVKTVFDGLVADRKGLMLSDIFRTLGFILVAAATLFLLIRKKISAMLASIVLIVFVFIDLVVIASVYLNSDNYQERIENENHFTKTKFDEEILADKSYYRVFNNAGNAFFEAITSYYYNSLGGYHAVKLRLYQDIIERQLGGRQPNIAVLNMLNTKYIIQKDRAGLTQAYQKNEGALGPCWLVRSIRYVKNPDEEMAALDQFNPRDTAIVQEMFKGSIPFAPAGDSAAQITIDKNELDVLSYKFNSSSNQFAVFSEIYYQRGWKAFIDGKEAPIVKTNYVLRGLAIPAGQHSIEFRFEPGGYLSGRKLTTIFSVILVVLLATAIFFEWRNRNRLKISTTG